jgi:hypothetical protein
MMIQQAKLHQHNAVHPYDYTNRSALHQSGLHRSEHTTSSCTTTSSYVKIIVEFYIAKVYIHVVFRRRRQKTPLPL